MTEHNHKPNFGRYVADCPRCVEKYPDGKPVRTRKVRTVLPVEAAAAAPMSDNDAMKELVRLTLEDRADKIRKENAAKASNELAKQQMRQSVFEAKEQERIRQEMCNHKKENGRTAINGQVHNDGLFHPFCFRCMKAFTPVRPSSDQMPTGVQVF